MPELPEVQTTVNGIRATVIGLKIADAWSDYNSPYFAGSETIKDPVYFAHFRKAVKGAKIIGAHRRAKNILIDLDTGATILIHMKMTGHVMYGKYRFDGAGAAKKDPWVPIAPESLKDPFNRHVHFMLSFSNGKHLALSDVRKFAKVTLLDTATMHESVHLNDLGPEPLEEHFKLTDFAARLTMRPNGKVKQVLTDQSILAGVGNIYADESLWRAGIHPLRLVRDISAAETKLLFSAVKQTLARGIDFGGDSTSDYRDINGDKGKFHESHNAYQRTGSKCDRHGCGGTIRRMVIGARSAHFCEKHQK
jgi:formamidopyrimidine-DNA glycosylase